MDELEKMNARYEEKSKGIFPFISKNRITVLPKGFHQKKIAKYRGVSFIYDSKQEKHKALLIGYYYVPKDYIIVPEGLTITEGKKKLIQDKLNSGYELILGFPSLKPYEFEEDSEEYIVAKKVNEDFKFNQ